MEVPSAPKQISLLIISFWVKPPCYRRAWAITTVRIHVFPPLTTCWSVSIIKILFHARITCACSEIQDWLSTIITPSTFKKRKLAPTTVVWVYFKTCSNMQSTISHLEPSNQCFMGLSKTFSYTNNVYIVVYFVMG